LLERQILFGPPGVKLGGQIIIKAQRGPRASPHNMFDALILGSLGSNLRKPNLRVRDSAWIVTKIF
jgi:hypothetical protein